MPSPLIGPIITGGAALLGQGINAASTSSMNKKTRKWNEKMYGQQRADALADWKMTNEYNSPQATMQRLKDAGLNPNLVYGDGATTTASPVRSSSVESWNPRAPQVDLQGAAAGSLSAYYDTQVKAQTIDNLKAQYEVLGQEKLLKMAQVNATMEQATSTGMSTQTKVFDLDLKKALKDINMSIAQENLRKLQVTNDFTLHSDQRAGQLQPARLANALTDVLYKKMAIVKGAEEINQIKQQIKNLQQDETQKRLDNALRNLGLQPGDKLPWRILGKLINMIPK